MKDAKGHGSNAGGSKASRERVALAAISARTTAAHQARVEMIGRATSTLAEFAKNTSGRGKEVPSHILYGRDVDATHDVLSDAAQVHYQHGHLGLDHVANLTRFLGCMAALAALTWIWSSFA